MDTGTMGPQTGSIVPYYLQPKKLIFGLYDGA